MAVPEPTFEVATIGTSIRLYVPGWGNGAETTHTIGPRLGRRLGAFFRGRGFDVVHVHAPYNPQMPAWAIDNTPDDALSIATFHSVFPQTLGMDIQAELIRPAIERLDGRVCVSEACIGSLTPYFPYAYDVIPNGIDTDHFSPDAEPVAELMGDHRSIVFVGRFDPRNGVDTMIQAHQLLFAERGPAVRLIVVGDGPLRPYYERMVSDAARPYVHFAGRLNRSRPNYLVTGDVFCTPCDRASFGMVLLEAMSCGRAVAASRISGFQLLMEDGRQGYLVHPAKSAERFATALARLLDDDAGARADGRRGAQNSARALRLATGRRAARELLLRSDGRTTTGMGKRQVISLFVALAAVWLTGAAVLAVALGGLFGDLVFAAAVLTALVLAWAAFTPNNPLFGRVIGGGRVLGPEGGDHLRRRAQRRVHAADPGRAGRGRRARHLLRAGPPGARPPRDRPPDRGRGPRAGQPRRRPPAAHLRGPDRDRPPAARAGRGGRGRHRRRAGAAVPRPSRLSQPLPGAGRAPPRLPRGGLDGGRLGHGQARHRADRRPQRVAALSRGDPAPARRRRLRQRRRPVADGRGAAADPRGRQGAGHPVRDHLRAGRRAAPAPAHGAARDAGGQRQWSAACCCCPPSST